MAVRMTGMISGLDTESLIQGMVDAQRLKNKRVEDKQTLLTWKQDKWKELNAKIYKLYTDDLSKMRLQSNYMTKNVTSSNNSLVSVVAGTAAPEGAHLLKVTQLASSQYITGGQLASGITTSTKLSDALIGMSSSAGNDLVIQIKNGETEKNLVVTENTTLGDFINAAKDAGLNASYDATQRRLFISSKSSGAANAFSITTGEMSETGSTALLNIQSMVNYSGLTSTNRIKVDAAIDALNETSITGATYDNIYNKVMTSDPTLVAANADEQKLINALTTLRDLAKTKIEKDTNTAAVQTVKEDIKQTLLAEPENASLTAEQLKALVDKEYASTELVDDGNGNMITKAALYQNQVKAEYDSNIAANLSGVFSVTTGSLYTSINTYVSNDAIGAAITNNLTKIGLDEITGAAKTATSATEVTVVAASDSKITLDGAELTGSSNIFNVNGLTITANGLTATGETVTLSVSNNLQGTYDMVKNFIKSYNELLKEMNELYYAPSSRGYDPLSDDEKEAMTDDQIEKWETKIQDSILRRDSSLGALIEGMRTSLNKSTEVGGLRYSLSSFGIQTSSDYTEKGLLHIYGDEDDSLYSGSENKLMKALEQNPDVVMEALSEITQNLYSTMKDKMESIPNVRSAFTFYNDKTMAKQQTEYAKQIAILESKLTDMENKYYKQFAAMETAMAKMQSQSNALAGMLGTSTQ